jgi:hypothetical protein
MVHLQRRERRSRNLTPNPIPNRKGNRMIEGPLLARRETKEKG